MGDGTIRFEGAGEFPMAPRGYMPPSIPPAGGTFPRGWDSAPGEYGSESPVVLGANQPEMPIPPAAQPAPESSTPDVVDIAMVPGRQSTREFLRTHQESQTQGLMTQPELDFAAVRAVAEVLAAVEHVNLANGQASYMGHAVALSTPAVEGIRKILAQEVCRQLDEERQRVLTGVQHQGMQGISGGGGANMPEVQEKAPAVVTQPKSNERAMS